MPLNDAYVLRHETKMRELTPSTSNLSIMADYANDGMVGGDLEQLWETLQEEIGSVSRFGMKFNFGKMKLYLIAGATFDPSEREAELIDKFRALGIQIDVSQNIVFMKTPIMGTAVFLSDYVNEQMEELEKVFGLLTKLPNPHVGFSLLKQAAGVCKVLFLMRSVPAEMIGDLFVRFDAKQRDTLQLLVGQEISDVQWEQAKLPIKLTGCGLRGASDGADAAYIMSRAMTKESCIALDKSYVGEGDVADNVFCGLGGAVDRINRRLPPEKRFGDEGACSTEDVDK